MSDEERALKVCTYIWPTTFAKYGKYPGDFVDDASKKITGAIAEARAEEREECAKVADGMNSFEGDAIASAIRAAKDKAV